MAAMKLLVLAVACYCASGLPQEPPKERSTIFLDEQLPGEIFEKLQENAVALNDPNPSDYRLPTTTKPVHYNVLWGVDFTTQTFSGTVQIQLHATQDDVNEIVIQSEDLTIPANTLNLQLGTTNVPVTFVEQPELQFLRIILTTGTLQFNANDPVIYTLSISFEAPLRDDMYGIYRSWFRNQHNEAQVSWMASTQFQATSARRAFPCYDEPSFKATFDITLRRPVAPYRSWSCTRIHSTVPTDNLPNYEDDIYYRTPIMSTYLLAIIIAEYGSLPVLDENNRLIYEVIARPAALADNQGAYALDVGQKLLAEMNEITDYDFYSVNDQLKMTQAAIPDFSAGAMENWGLLTYREAYLMYDPEHTTSNYKQLIAYILSHEIAHMWFGNLVTCDWWDELWLNEGFARYYQYFLTDEVEDHMGFETRFIPEQVHTAMLSDSVNNPHPLTNPGPVGSPGSVSAMFSTLSYNKGAAVIRMTEHLLGSQVHNAGLRNYLKNKEFQTARPIDLFENLEAAGREAGALAEYGPDFSLVEYYESFTAQPGVPVLVVHVDHSTGDMTIQQRRFNINYGYSNINTQWVIPISFSSASNPQFENTKPTHIIRKAVTIINRGSVGDEWVLFNRQQTGYYRVNYDDYTWDVITHALRGEARNQIHEHNKAQIVNDVFQYARAGIMTYTKALNILSFLEFETDYAPWVAALTGFNWLRQRLTGTDYLAPLEALIHRWAANALATVTYRATEDEEFMTSYFRWQLAPVMCQLDLDDCRAEATAQFNALRHQGVEVHPDSRAYVYCNGLRQGSEEDFSWLRTRFIESNLYTEKILILQNLGCTPHQASLNTFLTDIVTPNEMIRPQDYTTAFNSAVSGNEVNTQIVFQFIQQNLELVRDAFNGLNTPLNYVASRLRTEEQVDQYEQWCNDNAADLGNSLQAAINFGESARVSIQWRATIVDQVIEFINSDYQPIEFTTPTPVEPVAPPEPETRPDIEEPLTPELPSSAVAAFLSMTLLSMAAIFNFIV